MSTDGPAPRPRRSWPLAQALAVVFIVALYLLIVTRGDVLGWVWS